MAAASYSAFEASLRAWLTSAAARPSELLRTLNASFLDDMHSHLASPADNGAESAIIVVQPSALTEQQIRQLLAAPEQRTEPAP
jgi:hypothetical protein